MRLIRTLLLISVFTFSISDAVVSQTRKADSLSQLISGHPKDDTIRARLLLEYAMAILNNFPDTATKYNRLGLALAQKLNYRYGILLGTKYEANVCFGKRDLAQALAGYRKALAIAGDIGEKSFQTKMLINIGMVYIQWGITDSAKKYLVRAGDLAAKIGDENLQAKVMSEFGSVSSIQGDYRASINYNMKALAIYEKHSSPVDLASSHVKLGNLYGKIKDFNNSKKQYYLALKLLNSKNDKYFTCEILINIGMLYQKVKMDNDSALIFLNEAESLAKELNSEDLMLSLNINTGNLYFDQKNFARALEYYISASKSPLIRSLNVERTAVIVNLGTTYLYQGNLQKAEEYLTAGLKLAHEGHFLDFENVACESLSGLSVKKGNYKAAYEYAKRNAVLSDSLSGRDLKEHILEMQHKYDLKQVETSNQLLKKENELQEQIIFRQRTVVTGILIILVFISLLLFIIIHSRNKQKALAVELDEKNQKLQNLNLTKDKFFSIVAHDLRSPFNGLMGLLTELDESYEHYNEEMRRRMIHMLKESSYNTYNLLVNLLEWSMTQQERIENHAEVLVLEKVATEVIQTLRPRAEAKSQQLRMQIPVNIRVNADPNILRALLTNMINNAIKFTPVDGSITVYAIPEGNMSKICIEDTGIGIPEKELPNLFSIDSSFKRSGTEKEPGTGLGLIMCREYVIILGGEITIKSAIGKGTTICFTVPAVPAA